MFGDDIVIQALGVVCGILTILGVFVWIPWLDHRRDMALLRKGEYKGPTRKPMSPEELGKYVFLIGALSAAVGAAVMIGSYEAGGPETAKWLRFGGLVFLFVGLAMVTSYPILTGKKQK